MLYNDKNNPYDMNLINKISDYFAEVRTKYKEHEGSLKGIDTKMLYNQVPGGMLSNFESQLKNMEMIDKLDLLIEEIPKIRKDLGYIPLVTPTSQIVGTQALLNIQNSNRYDSLTNEMIDLVNGKYGKINGKISKDLRDKVKENQSSKQEKDLMTVNEYRNIFKQKCLENDLDNIYKNDKHLLNYILFPDITIDYYKELKRADEDQMYDLQEGLGILID